MPRPKVHDDALRVRLLEQAVRTLSDDGMDALSLRKLAAEVGTSTTAVYSLFGGKPELLNAVFDEAFARFGDRLASVTPSGDPRTDLYALAMAYRANALDEPHFYQVMFGSVGKGLEPDAESVRRAEATFGVLRDSVRRAMEAGQMRDADPVKVATAMWATVHGLVSLELRALIPAGAGDPAELYASALLALGRAYSAEPG
ncbi:MAG TPA: TetR/AcrR family transcriptional regulator [Pseudonocardia sp.]|jgi:AcrR family transcriptional regulator